MEMRQVDYSHNKFYFDFLKHFIQLSSEEMRKSKMSRKCRFLKALIAVRTDLYVCFFVGGYQFTILHNFESK